MQWKVKGKGKKAKGKTRSLLLIIPFAFRLILPFTFLLFTYRISFSVEECDVAEGHDLVFDLVVVADDDDRRAVGVEVFRGCSLYVGGGEGFTGS